MPIFVSKYSPGRVAGANLQRLSRRENQENGRTNAARGQTRAEQAREQGDAQGRAAQGRNDEALPVQTALAKRLQEQIRGQGNGRTGEMRRNGQAARETEDDDGAGVTQTRVGREAERRDVPAERRAEQAQRERPAVGVVRSRVERNAERPGRLEREPTNPAAEQALDRFARLREVGQGNASGAPAARTRLTPSVNQGIDARIRLLSTQTRGVGAQAAAQPTAQEISRANTTPEIRQNLQADTRLVERGLRRDAAVQAGENTRRTARAAAQGAETRREGEIRSGETEARALQTEARRLERELVQTQREIRNLENEGERLRGPVTRSAAASARALGSRVNLLVV